MPKACALPLVILLLILPVQPTMGQTIPLARLPAGLLDASAPSDRVRGLPRDLTLLQRGCRTLPTSETRRRIVDIAVQEWAFFGFHIVDSTSFDDEAGNDGPTNDPAPFDLGAFDGERRRPRVPPEEAMRIATSIAGYWAVTPEGSWIVDRMNERWRGPDGDGARWRDPWSAAFISWVMCEGGLGTSAQFQRAVAHHVYVDQAIRARGDRASSAAFVAYDAGETAIEPGDLLCSSRRPMYRTIGQRRAQAGTGARMHCDVVVKVDPVAGRVMAIGGNVRGRVAMKLLPAAMSAGGHLRPIDRERGEDTRPLFAHLKLTSPPIGLNALDHSPTIRAISCAASSPAVAYLTAANLPIPRITAC
ncbi:MAG: DUF2272 domain-containing protein [Vicinamibacterales bacterium]